MQVLFRLVFALVVLVAVAIGAAYWYLHRSLPQEEGEIRLWRRPRPRRAGGR